MPLLPVHFVRSHPNDILPAQVLPRRVDMGEERPPQLLVGFPQYLPSLFDRHFPHQRQGKRLKLLRQPTAPSLPRRAHRVNLPAALTFASRQRTHNLRLQLAHVEMPPPPFRRMIVATHRLAGAMGTVFLRPQLRRLFHPDQHPLFFFLVIHACHTPGFAQRQYLLKHLFRNHPRFSPRFPLALNLFTHYKRRRSENFS